MSVTRPTANRGAFTLIEVMVVLLILGVTIAVIGACLAAGIRVWDSARTFGAVESDALLAIEQIGRDLRNTFEFNDIPFEGDERAVAFPGIVRTGAEGASRLGRIRYALDTAEHRLIRETAVYDGRGNLEKERREALAGGVRELALAYWQTPRDDSPAGTATNLPAAVDITMTLITGPEEPEMPLTRTVRLPTGGGLPALEKSP
jgi:prepilin-type N-terminal cleavage/methylation domain-containing protein